MRSFQTLRFKLTIIYLLSIVTPFTVLAFVLPYYSQNMITKDTEQLIGGTLHVLSDTIRTYLDDLERLTAAPYMNDNIIQALKIKASRSYETANAYTKLQTDRALTGTLPNYLFNTREDILSTIIMPINSTAYLTSKDNTNRLQDDYPYSEQDWYKKAFLKNGKGAYISAHSQDYLTKQPTRQVFSVARLIKDPDSQQPLAVILSDADLNMFDKITREITFNVSSIVVILDEDKNILYSNNRLPEEIASEINPQGALLQRDFAEFVTVSERIAPADWEIVVFLNKAEIQSKVHWIYKIAVLLSIGGLIVTFFVFLYFSQGIVKPIKQMNEIMSRVKQGQLDSRYETATNDELSYLGHSLNKMIAQLDDLINREYKATLAQRDAEYYALQSQIQPHFLYNTLSGFVGLNRIGEKKKLEDSIISLSGMLRYMLDDNQWTTIEKEFQFLQKYSLLQLNRFADKLTIDIDYEESVAPFKIPKLLIQPILENAVIHGIEPDDKQNEINVTADFIERQGISYVQIIITDNGVGFDPEIQPLETQIGLVNVRARLELAYPNSSFHVTSSIGSGTTVTIIIETGGYHQ